MFELTKTGFAIFMVANMLLGWGTIEIIIWICSHISVTIV